MRPLYDTRAMPDVLLDVARRLKQPLTPALPWQTFEEMLQTPPVAAPEQPVSATLRCRHRRPRCGARQSCRATPASSRSISCRSRRRRSSTARWRTCPWLQELPDPLTTAMWSSWLELNVAHGTASWHRATATSSRCLGARVPAGAGRHLAGHRPRHGGDAGGPGPRALHALRQRPRRQSSARCWRRSTEPATGQLAWAATRVEVTKVADADGSLILFAGATRERPDTPGTRVRAWRIAGAWSSISTSARAAKPA